MFLNLGAGSVAVFSMRKSIELYSYAICTHFDLQLKGTMVFAMKSKCIKMAIEAFRKLTWTFQLRASQRP